MCSDILFKALLVATLNYVNVNTLILSPSPYFNLSKENKFFSSYYNRTKRQDEMIHTAVCSDLDRVENSPFIAMILVRNSGRLRCMASIIDRYHVLTTRNCINAVNIPSIIVVAGYASPHYGRNSQVKYVDRIAKHDKDLAILLLLKPFTFTNTVKSIRVIGPRKIGSGIDAYDSDAPYIVSGIVLPKSSPMQGELIPRGFAYQLKAEQERAIEVRTSCPQIFSREYRHEGPLPPMDDQYHFCTRGETQFCWTAMGSPTIVTKDNILIQVAMVVYARCKYRRPTPRPPNPPNPPIVDHSPYIHIRLDWFHKWVLANSFLDYLAD